METLSEPISLGVVRRGKSNPTTQSLTQALPKNRIETWVPIRDDFRGNTKPADPMFKKQQSCFLSSDGGLARYKPYKPTEAVHNSKHCIKSTWGWRQGHDKVHRHVVKHLGRVFQGLKKSRGLLSTALILLTNCTLMAKFQHRLKHILPIKSPLGSLQKLPAPQMATKCTSM